MAPVNEVTERETGKELSVYKTNRGKRKREGDKFGGGTEGDDKAR